VALELAGVIARLYTVPPEEFIAERQVAVGRAKVAGDAPLAAQISRLRKPTRAAWLVNLLAHQRPDLVEELLALGAELRDAQRELRGAELRELSLRRRATIGALVREARALAGAAGRPVREKVPEVEQTLTAALSDGYVAQEVRAGRLVKAQEYAGFGETPRPRLRLVQGGAPHAVPPPALVVPEQKAAAAPKKRAQPVPGEKREVKKARRELMAASLELVQAQVKRDAAAKALKLAEAAIAAAQRRADEATAILDRYAQ
jgi:hypothetical protein